MGWCFILGHGGVLFLVWPVLCRGVRADFCVAGVPSKDGSICCSKGCESCAGPGCERRPGGSKSCCGGSISALCRTRDGPPPCKFDPDWARGPDIAQAPEDGWCMMGKRNGGVCCAPECAVCGGAACTGACCGGHVARSGRLCQNASDVTCLIPESNATITSRSGTKASELADAPSPLNIGSWCMRGKKRATLCCDASCAECGGPACTGQCCGGFIVRQGRVCEQHTDVTCLIPDDAVSAPSDGTLPPARSNRVAWCSKGRRHKSVCCAASCTVCAGPGCSGLCCGGKIASSGRTCADSEDVTCMIPDRAEALSSTTSGSTVSQMPAGQADNSEGAFFRVEGPGGVQFAGKIHNAHAIGRGVILTLTHFVGCPHRYIDEMYLMAEAFILYCNREGIELTEIALHQSQTIIMPAGYVAPGNLRAKTLSVHTYVTPATPMCCSGSRIDDATGHVADSPCRAHLDSGVTLVRMARLSPVKEQTAGCALDVVCPDDYGPGVGGVCCTGPTMMAKLIQHSVKLRRPPKESIALETRAAQRVWPEPHEHMEDVQHLWNLMIQADPTNEPNCASTFLLRLSDLVDLADVSPAGETLPVSRWAAMQQNLEVCRWLYRYRFVEYTFDASGFLERHGVERSSWGSLPEGRLVVRFCAPARYPLHLHTGGYPNTACDVNAVGRELVRLVIGVKFNALAAFANAPVPSPQDVQPNPVPWARRPENAIEDDAAVAAEDDYWNNLGMIKRLRVAQVEASKAAKVVATKTSSQGMGSQLRVAMCVVGVARSFHKPKVHASILENVSGSFSAGTDVRWFHIWESEAGRRPADFFHVLKAFPPATPCISCAAPRLSLTQNLSCGLAVTVPQFLDLHHCLGSVEAFERDQGWSFDWLIRLRTDTVWHAPIGPLEDFDTSRIHVPRKYSGDLEIRFGKYTDKFALVPRHLATAYFNVVKEPAMCSRMKQRLGRLPCGTSPIFSNLAPTECFFDLRFERLDVPIAIFPQLFDKYQDEYSRSGTGRTADGLRYAR